MKEAGSLRRLYWLSDCRLPYLMTLHYWSIRAINLELISEKPSHGVLTTGKNSLHQEISQKNSVAVPENGLYNFMINVACVTMKTKIMNVKIEKRA